MADQKTYCNEIVLTGGSVPQCHPATNHSATAATSKQTSPDYVNPMIYHLLSVNEKPVRLKARLAVTGFMKRCTKPPCIRNLSGESSFGMKTLLSTLY